MSGTGIEFLNIERQEAASTAARNSLSEPFREFGPSLLDPLAAGEAGKLDHRCRICGGDIVDVQAAIFDEALLQQLNAPAIIGVMRGGLLRRDIRCGDIRTIVHFQLLAFDQSRCCRARAVPMPKMQARLLKARSKIAHHPRQEAQFERRVGFDLFDVFVGKLVAPILHLGDEIGFFLGRAPAVDHALDDGAE